MTTKTNLKAIDAVCERLRNDSRDEATALWYKAREWRFRMVGIIEGNYPMHTGPQVSPNLLGVLTLVAS